MEGAHDPAQVFDFEVTDAAGETLGRVDKVWVDDVTNELEFVGVKMGRLIGKTHIIPLADARIGEGTIRVPYDGETIKHAPTFGDDELSPQQEDTIYDYFGLASPADELETREPTGTDSPPAGAPPAPQTSTAEGGAPAGGTATGEG